MRGELHELSAPPAGRVVECPQLPASASVGIVWTGKKVRLRGQLPEGGLTAVNRRSFKRGVLLLHRRHPHRTRGSSPFGLARRKGCARVQYGGNRVG